MSAPVEIQAIIAQLGGPRIFAMAFERVVYSVRGDDSQRPPSKGPAGATFAIARGLRRMVKATHVVVELEDDDTYTVSLHKHSTRYATGSDELARTSMVYADQLRGVVEGMTGLRMSL